jgi:hypothetical protein
MGSRGHLPRLPELGTDFQTAIALREKVARDDGIAHNASISSKAPPPA